MGNGHRRVVVVPILIGWLKVQGCLSAAAPSKGIHVLDFQDDAGLKALKVLCEAASCCRQSDAGHVLNDEAVPVLQSLQLQSMQRLYGAPLMQGPVSVV